MTSLANSVPGLISYWGPLVSSPFYYASSENNWDELILPYLPTSLVPHDLAAIRAFFEGNEGQASAIPWEVWLTPLLRWLPLIVALHVATLCLMVVVRRHWVWWPLHPIGFPISSTFHWMAFNAFLAWLIKGPVLYYGGVHLYRQVRPFFLGMILGHFAIFGVFWVIDSFTGMIGNGLFL